MEFIIFAYNALYWVERAVILGIVIAAVWGAIQVAVTRDDAFMVIDRSKQNWMLILGGAGLAALLLGLLLPQPISIAWIAAAVVVGIYWQDIRPSVRDVLDNSSDW